MRGLLKFGVVLAAVLIGIVYVARTRVTESAPVPQSFVVSMQGTAGTSFTLQCMAIQADGGSASQSFVAVVPAQYTLGGRILSCVGQKQQVPGTLKMFILKGSSTLQTSETAAAYGVVQAATQ